MARCQAEVDSEEFASWQAYDRTVEPVGLTWEPLANICSLIDAFMAGFAGRRGRPAADFIPVKRDRQRIADMAALAEQYVRARSRTQGRRRGG